MGGCVGCIPRPGTQELRVQKKPTKEGGETRGEETLQPRIWEKQRKNTRPRASSSEQPTPEGRCLQENVSPGRARPQPGPHQYEGCGRQHRAEPRELQQERSHPPHPAPPPPPPALSRAYTHAEARREAPPRVAREAAPAERPPLTAPPRGAGQDAPVLGVQWVAGGAVLGARSRK